MTYEVVFPTRDSEDLLDSAFADLESALGYAAWGMDNHPQLLTGWRDIAVIREFMGSVHPIASVVRVDDEFMLVKDTNDQRFTLELLALEHGIFRTEDGMEYTVYRRWDALDA